MTLLIIITLGCSFSSPQIPRHVTEAAAKPLLSDPGSVQSDRIMPILIQLEFFYLLPKKTIDCSLYMIFH